jgi:hypothetical protein
MKLGLVAILLAGVAGCPAPVGSRAPVPSDSTAQCREYCQNIGLPLESVVIMASNVGCVCDARPPMPMAPMPPGPPSGAPPAPPPTSSTGASSTAGGMAAVMMEEAEEQQQHNQQQTSTTMMMHH